jgi:hypothetical protein
MSKLNYYRYLKKYTPGFLRQHQTNLNYDLGRRSHWDALVEKMGHESMGEEGYISPNHKAPVFWNRFVNRVMWFFTILYAIWFTLFVGDQVEAFLIDRSTNPNVAGGNDDQYGNYNDMYVVQRPHPRQFV